MIRRLAAPAPDREPPSRAERLEAVVHNTCVLWAGWVRSRRLYGSPRPLGSIMEAWVRVPGRSTDERDARCDAQLAQFQAAINDTGNDPARRMFEVHFLKPKGVHIKAVCEQYQIPRATWYRQVNTFARTVYRRAFHDSY